MIGSGLPWQLMVWLTLTGTLIAADTGPNPGTDDMLRNAAELRLETPPSTENPRIVEHPQDDFFPKNEPASLNCKAEGNPPPTITWYKDGQLVETNKDSPTSHRMLLDNGQLFFLRVIHSKNSQPDIGVYYCNATNKHGWVISNKADVQIAVLKDKFLAEPTDTTTSEGKSVTLYCDPPRGKPDPKVIWRMNGDPVQTNERIHITDTGNLVIDSVQKSDIGEYLCVATNKGGEKQSSPATLKVLAIPEFNKLPRDVSVDEGQSAEFHCDVVGDPPIKVTWTKEGGAISFGRARIESDRTLHIERVEPGDGGQYICTAENAAGSAKAPATLTVYSKPSFAIKPQDQVVARGRTVSLQCIPVGNPHPTVFWSKEADKGLMFSYQDTDHYQVMEDGSLRIRSVNDSDAGVYKCEALNTRGAATATARIQVVASDHRPPPVIKLGPQNQTLPVSHKAVFRCVADGKPEPILRWYKNGRPLLIKDPRIKMPDPGTLEISDLRQLDTGSYTCKAVSSTGETTWEAFLSVIGEGSGFPVRSSAVAFLPDPPARPVVSEVTDTTVHLSWTPGQQNEQYPVEKFYVEYFGYETNDGWMIASRDVQRESYTLEGLQRNTTYMFLVRAVNSQGVGYPSQLSDPVKTLAQHPDANSMNLSEEEVKERLNTNLVELRETLALNSTAVNISWTLPQSDNLIGGYEIVYKHIIVMDVINTQYGESRTVRVKGSKHRWHVITGLQPYSWYELQVASYSGNVVSFYSGPVKIQTGQPYKASAPENVSVHKRTDSIVSVLWSPPKTANRMITGYLVSCYSKDRRVNCSVMTDAKTYSYTLKNLQPSLTYVIRVAALTRSGVGVYSDTSIFDKEGIHPASDLSGMSTDKPVTEEGDEDLFKKPWFVGVLIGVGGVMLWLILCIFSIWLCKRRKQQRKLHKEKRYYHGVPVEKGDEHNRNMFIPPYGSKTQATNNDGELPPELRVLLPGQQQKKVGGELSEETVYKVAGDGSRGNYQPEMKTFYSHVDPVAPYATTALLQQQHLLKQRQQGGDPHLFRPINQGYLQHSEGSGDSCQKPALSSDSNLDQSRHSHSTTDHNHSDHLSPTSDSGSHSTDENNLLIKQKKKSQSSKKDNSGMKAPVNWHEMLPPPPDHPPPSSECGDVAHYSDARSNTRSPMSPVSFSQLSACSCPNPHTQTPVSGWNMPVYSDNECPRCHSEKYYDPMAYCQEAFIRRTNSPRTQLSQHVNNRNMGANATPNCAVGHNCSPHSTPCGSVHYQYTNPGKNPHSNCATPQMGDNNSVYNNVNISNKSNNLLQQHLHRASHSSHSDNETPQGMMPCFQQYRIAAGKPGVPGTVVMGSDPRYAPEDWQVDPQEQDSGMGMEEDGLPCVARGYQQNMERRGPMMTSDHHPAGYPSHECDSPTSEMADYAESDLDHSHTQNNTSVEQHTDCSSLQSSEGSSVGDGTFQTEEDFASAVARAAELSGLTVIGTTVSDPACKAKKEKRQRRPARPVSPGYSTDSNYGTIDMVRKPYPKSQRKQQLIEQGKNVPNRSAQVDVHDRSMFVNPREASHYDAPFSRVDYPMSFSTSATPLSPNRFSSLSRMPPQGGSIRQYDRGHYSSALSDKGGYSSALGDKGGYSSFHPHNIITMPMKEDIV